MKSVVNERARTRGLVIGAVFAGAVVGVVGCRGSTDHKSSPHRYAGRPPTPVGGPPGAPQRGPRPRGRCPPAAKG